jgi:hypothetical protein
VIYQHEIEERRARASYDPGDRVMPEFAGPEYYEEQDEYLRARDLSPKLARENGWYPSMRAGDSLLRIVMPASPAALNHYQARLIERPVMEGAKRYQSSHGARGPAVIIVYPGFIERLAIAVVEGPMDALAAAGAGLVGVSLMGNTPPVAALEHIASLFQNFRALVVPDRDSYAEAARTMTRLAGLGMRAELRTIFPWKDLAEVPRGKREAALFV